MIFFGNKTKNKKNKIQTGCFLGALLSKIAGPLMKVEVSLAKYFSTIKNNSSLYTSSRIRLLWNCFSNYVYLKNMYMSLKGIGKSLFVSVLRTC